MRKSIRDTDRLSEEFSQAVSQLEEEINTGRLEAADLEEQRCNVEKELKREEKLLLRATVLRDLTSSFLKRLQQVTFLY